MEEYVFGANILENLTTGMYQDSKVIYREYIQNACDQIDKAVEIGLLEANEGKIEIWLDNENRIVVIEDNATGIPKDDFKKTLCNIADSQKKLGKDKGFRGIGRLCGLAYCREVVFTTTASGENTISIMRCDAKKMRDFISRNELGEKYTASEVLSSINEFTTDKTDDVESHWFKVELIGINEENTDLLDFSQIKEYLSFVAPVPYQNKFIYKTEIFRKAIELDYTIDQYDIRLDGEPIFKNYGTHFKTSKGEDEIFDIEFKEIRDLKGNLLAWSWIGVSHFKAIISKCPMRGLRLRKENIQIGNEDTLQKLFKEDRGNHYFIGEVFAVSEELIPNSQRDYFNENHTRVYFENELRRYFAEELKRIYYAGSAINSAYQKIDIYEKKEAEFQEKQEKGEFTGKNQLEAAVAGVEKARKDAEKAKADIDKKRKKAEEDREDVVSRVLKHIELERSQQSSAEKENILKIKKTNNNNKNRWRVDKLSSYSKNERKLISKIFDIIAVVTDDSTAEMIIQKIEEELK